jgi:hypothetical protein
MAQYESRLEDSPTPQVSLGEFRAVRESEKGSASANVDAPRVLRTGGSGGGGMEDILKRLGSLESSVGEIKALVSGIAGATQHFATKADVKSVEARVCGIEAAMQHCATKADVTSLEAHVSGITAVKQA